MARKITQAERNIPQTRRKLSPEEIAENLRLMPPTPSIVDVKTGLTPKQERIIKLYGHLNPSEGEILGKLGKAQFEELPPEEAELIPKTISAEEMTKINLEAKKGMPLGVETGKTKEGIGQLQPLVTREQALLEKDERKMGEFAEAAEIAIGLTAQGIDLVTSTFSVRKQADVVTAEASFNDAIGQIERNIISVAAGRMSSSSTKTDFQLAKTAIGRLESSQKGAGRINLRYWLGGGKEVEGELIIFKERLAELKLEMDILAATQIELRRQQMINAQQFRG